MNRIQVEIINPKAAKLLQNLAEMKLIAISNSGDDGFMKLVNKIRAKAKHDTPSLEEITKEVEIVRAARYAKRKR